MIDQTDDPADLLERAAGAAEHGERGHVATAIRQAREALDWTQADLADRLGLAVQTVEQHGSTRRQSDTVGSWERGDKTPDRRTREAMRELANEVRGDRLEIKAEAIAEYLNGDHPDDDWYWRAIEHADAGDAYEEELTDLLEGPSSTVYWLREGDRVAHCGYRAQDDTWVAGQATDLAGVLARFCRHADPDKIVDALAYAEDAVGWGTVGDIVMQLDDLQPTSGEAIAAWERETGLDGSEMRCVLEGAGWAILRGEYEAADGDLRTCQWEVVPV